MKPALLKLALKRRVREEEIPLEDIEAELPDLPEDDSEFDLDWDRVADVVPEEKEPTVLETVMNRYKKRLFSPKTRQSDTIDGDQDVF